MYDDIASQLDFLEQFPALRDHLPFNSIQRRNIGLLKAYLASADVIITIDDDNFLIPTEDFIGQHGVVGKEQRFSELTSSSGWFNVANMLIEERGLPFYHRGYPLSKRWVAEEKISRRQQSGKVTVNAGLWLDAPDIDAVTWLNSPIRALALREEYTSGIALAPGTWSPFNSQNTALAREVIPAYFLSPYIGRYDDIWASYIVKKIADHLGHVIQFGRPLVRQERNRHNYFADFDKERFGLETTTDFVDALTTVRLAETTYGGCFHEITEWLHSQSEEIFSSWLEKYRYEIDQLIAGYRIWDAVHSRILQSEPA
jgi:hypothetical protein